MTGILSHTKSVKGNAVEKLSDKIERLEFLIIVLCGRQRDRKFEQADCMSWILNHHVSVEVIHDGEFEQGHCMIWIVIVFTEH